ncbi:MAG: HEAT repeat domain-containing protein [Ilumatobacteraceae bacterium]
MTGASVLRTVIMAGHRGDGDTARAHVAHHDPTVRAAALGALERIGALTDDELLGAMHDVDPEVRRRVAELLAIRPGLDLAALLDDTDPSVVEVAAWACGEQVVVSDDVLGRVIDLTTGSDDALVREAGAAALGAIGDERGLDAVLAACSDKPNVRRRAVLALAPFEGERVDAAIDRALEDRDWQVRQAAEDLRRAEGMIDLG